MNNFHFQWPILSCTVQTLQKWESELWGQLKTQGYSADLYRQVFEISQKCIVHVISIIMLYVAPSVCITRYICPLITCLYKCIIDWRLSLYMYTYMYSEDQVLLPAQYMYILHTSSYIFFLPCRQICNTVITARTIKQTHQ